RRPAPRAGGGVDGRAGFGLSRARRGYGGPLRGELTSPVQDDMRDQVVQPADVDVLAEIDLDVAGPRPQFELGVEVQDSSRVLGRPHVDRVVGQRVDLDLLAGEALRVSHDQARGGEDGGVSERLISRDRLLTLDQQGADVLRDRAFGDAGPRGDGGDGRGQGSSDLVEGWTPPRRRICRRY